MKSLLFSNAVSIWTNLVVYSKLFILFFIFFCRGYVGIHSSGFRDFLLKPELLRAIVDSGFEHPSEGKISLHSSHSNSWVEYICLPLTIDFTFFQSWP